MHEPLAFPLVVLVLTIVAGQLYISLLTLFRIKSMADFTALNATLAKLQATATALASYVDTLKNADDQSSVDAANTTAQGLETTLAALLPASLTVSPTSLSVTVGQPVSDSLSVSGGTSPYTYVASDTGLSVDSTGVVTGTVASAGESTITVSDSSSPVQTFTVTVTAS